MRPFPINSPGACPDLSSQLKIGGAGRCTNMQKFPRATEFDKVRRMLLPEEILNVRVEEKVSGGVSSERAPYKRSASLFWLIFLHQIRF